MQNNSTRDVVSLIYHFLVGICEMMILFFFSYLIDLHTRSETMSARYV